ncbi:electron transport complex subunit RsxC [Erwinia persicina]|uniref:electron transport complex subunit RsxC n=1 Tax=Erwinia persicina TaxID=55211 RepID=UPI000E4E5622|nr:electron transport complex subunit RsxC [Erwinia persicina]AXU95312.1 electron transport complex subunit RsxC [Erwinia persicina]
MFNLLNFLKKDRLWDFKGGIHPPEMKTQSNGTPLRELPLPAQFILPLKQHIGPEGELAVRPGDRVLRGQALTFGSGRMLPIHAPTSGTVTKIAPHMTAHPSALAEMCLFMTPDGEDRWVEKRPLSDYRSVERSELVEKVHQAGVAGLGGAGFPTATKLKGGLRGVNTLIINAAECEPYITADDRLMQDCAREVLEGSRILAFILQAEQVLIGIEDNKPQAIAALKQALGSDTDLQIRVIPTKYPSGGAKQLTKILTGKEVPHGGRSTDIGVLMQNVGTAFAVKRAVIDGEALTERVVTLTGGAVARPGNVWARLGTPISHLLQQAEFSPGAEQMVVMGGPLMGFTLPTLDVPVVKITNCILAPAASEMGQDEPEQNCIRCSACADACPAALLPQQLYWYSRGGDHEKAREHNIADCIECGACAYVCPSNIPLVQYYRQEKAEIQAIDLEAERTALAKARFEARQLRLEREKAARDARHQQAKRSVAASDADAIAAARERVKAKQADPSAAETADRAVRQAEREARRAEARVHQAEQQAVNEPVTRQATDPRQAAVEAAIARAKAKKAAQASATAPAETNASPAEPPVDARKAAVEAAIARAKAKKAAQASATAPAESDASPAEPPVDARKAAVEAAIARAKAKKAAQASASAPDESDTSPAEPPVDARKAAVEAAIARAKAKKAAQASASAPAESDTSPAEPPVDARKAAVEAAIARAKAKKAAQASASAPAESDTSPAEPPVDARKAAVEAAIARAKAKKAAQASASAPDESDTSPAEPPVDARKAAVEAAIARAKAKKAAQRRETNDDNDEAPAASDDARKAAVAAAIARVKARQSQQPSAQED